MNGVILYGPPAAGKDTVTAVLNQSDPRFQVFRRIKVGGGKTHTYRIVELAALEALRRDGGIIWENSRYGATYAIDRAGLQHALRASVPVVHVGQPEAVTAVLADDPVVRWLVVDLRCSRDVAAARLVSRDPSDVASRLAVWDATAPLVAAGLRVDTGVTSPEEAARQIRVGMRDSTRAGVSHLSHLSPKGC